MVKETLKRLRRLVKGTPIKIRAIRGTDNIIIHGAGFKPLARQVGGNVGISATTVIKARITILKRNKRRLMQIKRKLERKKK